ncbi:hypothetical protein KUCAC02_028721 [Chaenocephalus aceratus]|uniref:Uncharacterized protein n=1 Tax=Chaenocephalus aceratus TaxID=36190 RepID=A0ACB9X2V1_CHAAC|nr:hypothetical protein KUCAC02_028721 [Chaenocephalus aceratus]
MVLDYGTHVITSVDTGATLVQEDLSSSYVSDNLSEGSSVKAQTGLNFFDKLKFYISSQNTQQSSVHFKFISPIFSTLLSQAMVAAYLSILASLCRRGRNVPGTTWLLLIGLDSPCTFINTNTFPDLPQPTVGKVAIAVSQAVERYYKVNTRPGCVDVT